MTIDDVRELEYWIDRARTSVLWDGLDDLPDRMARWAVKYKMPIRLRRAFFTVVDHADVARWFRVECDSCLPFPPLTDQQQAGIISQSFQTFLESCMAESPT